jgi:hypothetical protein
MKKSLIAICLVLGTGSALAWGPREQGALTGLVIGSMVAPAISGQIIVQPGYSPYQVYPPPVRAYTPPVCGVNVYCGPNPVPGPQYRSYCQFYPIMDQYGREIGRERICN